MTWNPNEKYSLVAGCSIGFKPLLLQLKSDVKNIFTKDGFCSGLGHMWPQKDRLLNWSPIEQEEEATTIMDYMVWAPGPMLTI